MQKICLGRSKIKVLDPRLAKEASRASRALQAKVIRKT